MNSSGPGTEPRGTLQSTPIIFYWTPSTEKDCDRSVKYELNHSNGIPSTANQRWKTSISVQWFTVSNAALRSNRTSAVTSPRSIVRMISFMTLTTAVSVLRCRRYADWFNWNNLWRSACAVNLVATTRSCNNPFNELRGKSSILVDMSWHLQHPTSASWVVEKPGLTYVLLEDLLTAATHCRSHSVLEQERRKHVSRAKSARDHDISRNCNSTMFKLMLNSNSCIHQLLPSVKMTSLNSDLEVTDLHGHLNCIKSLL